MSVWPSQPGVLSPPRPVAGLSSIRSFIRHIDRHSALWVAGLIGVLLVQGAAITQSYIWAAPLLCILFIALAPDLPLKPFLALTLLARVLTDDLAPTDSRHSSSLNLSGGIAALFILVAIGLLIRRRRGATPAILAVLWLLVWTAIAVRSTGLSGETLREGVREVSVVALAVIVVNARGLITVSLATRLVQAAGTIPALLALYQFATHTGLDVAGQIRANGTFVHPNSAAIFFAIATIASIWQYVDNGRRRLDAMLIVTFSAATIATFSIDGLGALLVMIMAFGTLRPGAFRIKLGSYIVAIFVVIAFLATPLGAERIENESTTNFSASQTRHSANTSLAWRFYKWGTLIPLWERSPYLGNGLGTTTTSEGNSENAIEGKVPHNEYLRYLVETGIIGLTILLGAITLLIRRLARIRRISGTLAAGTVNVGTLGLTIVIGCLVNSLADNTLLNSTTGYAAALIIFAVLTSQAHAWITLDHEAPHLT
jgi:O-antigen ligase